MSRDSIELTTPRRLPTYPITIPAVFVVGFYVATSAPGEWLWRPLGLSVLAGVLVYCASAALLRSWLRGAVLATAGVVALLDAAMAAVALGVPIGLLVWHLHRLARRPLPSLAQLTRVADVLGGLLLVVVSVQAVPLILSRPTDLGRAPTLNLTGPHPDIYVLLIDGYARADTMDAIGFDNGPFLAELERRGFSVSDHAESNYRITKGTVPSMMHMRNIPDLDIQIPESLDDQARLLRNLLNDAPALDGLRAVGYKVISIPPGFALTDLREADELVEHGYPTEFEQALIERSAVDSVLHLVMPNLMTDLWRERISRAFADVRAISRADVDEPRFVYAHVMTPHAPFVFNADGSAAKPPACYPEACRLDDATVQDLHLSRAEIAALYTAQVRAINPMILETIDAILADSDDAVIVLTADHGSRIDADDLDEWYRPLFAAHTPRQPALFGEAVSPTQTMALLLNAYLGGSIPVPPMVRYEEIGPLTYKPVK